MGGMPTKDGGVIAKGKLLRSGKLYKLPEETVKALREYGVTTIVDLRIFTECDETPDTLWDEAEYYHLPILCTATPGITREKSMCLKDILRMIIDNEGCILWHCSAGKDRAGIVAMLVESLLGVDDKTIIQDYTMSKQFLRRKFFWNKFGLRIVPLKRRFKKILIAMMEAKPEYLLSPIREIEQKYGSVTEYCKAELGVTDADIAKMKEKYLIY